MRAIKYWQYQFSSNYPRYWTIWKDNLDIFITIFEYGGFHKIKEDDNDDESTKERIVIKDVRVSPYALKRKHLDELLIIKDKEKRHFTTIKSISKLLRGSKHDSWIFYCKKCYCSITQLHYALMLKAY